MVQADDERTFVVADIPGLIEGAHEGHGLGDRFLRHIERTGLLLHLVDVSGASGRDPSHDFDVILKELASFSEVLAKKPMFVAANKMDAAQDPKLVRRIAAKAARRKMPFFKISAVTGAGVPELVRAMADAVAARRQQQGPPAEAAPLSTPATGEAPAVDGPAAGAVTDNSE